MQAGDIIFVKAKGWLSKTVTFFDKGAFSHVAVAISPTHIIEAQYYTKLRIVPFRFGEDEIEVIDLNLTQEERNKMVDVGIKLTGRWYDYPQIFGYVFRKIFKLEGRNLFNNPNNLICSELLYYLLLSIDKIKVNEHLEDMTPNELYNFCKNLCAVDGANCKETSSKKIDLNDFLNQIK